MIKKTNILILASIIGLIALSVVQGYLIKNTYTLKKEAFLRETKKIISRIDDFSPALEKLSDDYQDYYLDQLIRYKQGAINKEEVLNNVKLKADSINIMYSYIYKKELAKKNIPFKIKHQKRIKSVILLDSLVANYDIVYFSNKTTPELKIFGEDFELDEAHRVSNSLWMTDHIYQTIVNGKEVDLPFSLQGQLVEYMNIDGWKSIIWGQMMGLLLLSIFIFLMVLGLLYYSIKNLINQKKISDVKTDFINNITHELKTPLATLTLATKMLKNNKLLQDSEMARSTVDIVERQNKRLQNLIDQVMTNSLGYKEIKLSKEILSTYKYINTVLDDFEVFVKDKNVELVRKIKNMGSKICIDKFYLTTALLNILENSVKYNGDDIRIVCETNEHNNFKVVIEDNGIGISKKNQQYLFDKFYRAGDKDKHNVKGLGLGLYYTHQIIKAHEGEILIESEEGKGTKVSIIVPINV